MEIVDIVIGALLIVIGIVILKFVKSDSKYVGSDFGYVFRLYIGGFGFLLIGIVMIIREIFN